MAFSNQTLQETSSKVVECGAANKDKMISVIAIVNDDEVALSSFLSEVSGVLRRNFQFFEIVLIDNHSGDGSFDLVRRQTETMANLRLLRLSRYHHREVSLAAGIEHCVGDYAIIMNVYTDRPEDIPKMIEAAEQGSDVVLACPTSSQQISRYRRLGYRMTGKILGHQLDPQASYFRLFSRRAIGAMSKIRQRRRFLKYFSSMVGFRQTIVTSEPHTRAGDAPTKHRVFGLLARAIDVIFSHTAFPLRMMTFLGVAASIGNLAYLSYVFVMSFVKDELAEGWLTTSVMIGSMFFILFAMLTVFAEYIARIYEEVKDQPLYFVETELQSRANTHPDERPLNVA